MKSNISYMELKSGKKVEYKSPLELKKTSKPTEVKPESKITMQDNIQDVKKNAFSKIGPSAHYISEKMIEALMGVNMKPTPYGTTLPIIIEQTLSSDLSELKNLLTNKSSVAIKLAKAISSATSRDDRFKIDNIIREDFDYDIDTSGLQAICGELLRLILGNDSIYKENKIEPIYHDIIQEKILKAFDLDITSLGQIQESNEF